MTELEVRTGDAPEIEAFLAQRIYEYNAAATGYHDGEAFTCVHRDDRGNIEAGACGHTWGGCCYIASLWVTESRRGRGLGGDLLRAVERHALGKQCKLVLLATHTFQAPELYASRGYVQLARINDYPIGHADVFFAKRLTT